MEGLNEMDYSNLIVKMETMEKMTMNERMRSEKEEMCSIASVRVWKRRLVVYSVCIRYFRKFD